MTPLDFVPISVDELLGEFACLVGECCSLVKSGWGIGSLLGGSSLSSAVYD